MGTAPCTVTQTSGAGGRDAESPPDLGVTGTRAAFAACPALASPMETRPCPAAPHRTAPPAPVPGGFPVRVPAARSGA